MSKKPKPTLRQLVEAYRERIRDPGEPPVTIAELCEDMGLSRSHLNHLMAGRRGATKWTIERIASVLDLDVSVVTDALSR